MHFYDIISVLFCGSFFVEVVDIKEHCACIKFCFRLGKSVVATHKMLKQLLGEDVLGQMQTYDLFKEFNP